MSVAWWQRVGIADVALYGARAYGVLAARQPLSAIDRLETRGRPPARRRPRTPRRASSRWTERWGPVPSRWS